MVGVLGYPFLSLNWKIYFTTEGVTRPVNLSLVKSWQSSGVGKSLLGHQRHFSGLIQFGEHSSSQLHPPILGLFSPMVSLLLHKHPLFRSFSGCLCVPGIVVLGSQVQIFVIAWILNKVVKLKWITRFPAVSTPRVVTVTSNPVMSNVQHSHQIVWTARSYCI